MSKSLRKIINVTLVKGLGAILSFVTVAGIANLLGANSSTDAYFLARRISSNIAVALDRYFMLINVPKLVDLYEKQGLSQLGARVRSAEKKIFLYALVPTLLLVLLARPFVRLIAPGFEGEQLDEAVFYFQILVIVLPITAATAYSGATMNALKLFSLPALLRLLPRVCVVIALGVIWAWQFSVQSLAIAVLIGSVVMGIIFVVKTRGVFEEQETTAKPKTKGPMVQFTGQRVWAMLIAQLHVIGAGWIDLYFISTTGDGAVSSWDIGQRLVNFLPGAMTGSVMLVYYTNLAESFSQRDTAGFVKHTSDSMRLTLLTILPVAAVLFSLSLPLTEVLLHHGAFDQAGVDRTSIAVQALALLLPVNAMLGVLTAVLFVRSDVSHIKVIVLVLTVSLAVRIGTDLALLPSLGFTAVPIGTCAGMASLLIMLLLVMSRKFGALFTKKDAGTFALLILGFLLTIAVTWWLSTLIDWSAIQRLPALAAIIAIGMVGVLVYGGFAYLIGVPEVNSVRTMLKNRISKKSV